MQGQLYQIPAEVLPSAHNLYDCRFSRRSGVRKTDSKCDNGTLATVRGGIEREIGSHSPYELREHDLVYFANHRGNTKSELYSSAQLLRPTEGHRHRWGHAVRPVHKCEPGAA